MQTVHVALGDRSYDILVAPDLLAESGPRVAGVLSPRKVLVVTDETVAGLLLEPVVRSLADAGFDVATATAPPGEGAKCYDELARLHDACFDASLDRDSAIVALGGGVVGDLAGFVAATYMRGIACVQMPTTLLAQVDSSVGGKTGINTAGGKNLVGAFHQPSLVLADVRALGSLPEREFTTGMAEVIKHAMIRDAELFDRLEAGADALRSRDAAELERIVAANCRIKAEVVAGDEREAGLRAILNYGHTVGHAVERLAGYGAYTHGEAVALGMHAEADIARQRGLIDEATHRRQWELLEVFALPTRLTGPLDADEMIESMRHDKKVRGGKVRFVVPEAIGAVRIVDDVSENELRAALDRIQP